MKLLLCGDVSPTPSTNPLFKEKQINRLFSKKALNLFEGNDVNFVNLEVALTEHDGAIEKFGPALKASPMVADVLKEIGVTVCGLSNNHIFDYGKQGVLDTMENLDRVGLDYTGFGNNLDDSRKNYYIEKNGEKVCLITVCEHEYSYAIENRMGARPFDVFDTMLDIRAAKEKCDRVIVLYHGGKEHCRYPSPRLVKACRAMIKNGADVVLCQHSHCVGCYEEFEGGHILYGQGNFHFVKFGNESLAETWNTFLAAHYETKENKLTFTPMTNDDCGITVAEGELADEILNGLKERSQSLSDGSYVERWREVCKEKFSWYIDAVGDAGKPNATYEQNHRLAHFLDCEAHHDVLCEFFKTSHNK